jgi:hypothetical protein
MPKDYHEDLGHGGQPKKSQPNKAAGEQLDATDRAQSQAGAGFQDEHDEYKQTGFGQAGYRAAKNKGPAPKAGPTADRARPRKSH